MGHGGARPGSGRKKGSASRANEIVRLRAAAEGELPLDYMLRIMRDPKAPWRVRHDMAKAAAPYLHAKLTAVTHAGDPKSPLATVTRIERVITRARGLERPKDSGPPIATTDLIA
jgi:hypothetical protein